MNLDEAMSAYDLGVAAACDVLRQSAKGFRTLPGHDEVTMSPDDLADQLESMADQIESALLKLGASEA